MIFVVLFSPGQSMILWFYDLLTSEDCCLLVLTHLFENIKVHLASGWCLNIIHDVYGVFTSLCTFLRNMLAQKFNSIFLFRWKFLLSQLLRLIGHLQIHKEYLHLRKCDSPVLDFFSCFVVQCNFSVAVGTDIIGAVIVFSWLWSAKCEW